MLTILSRFPAAFYSICWRIVGGLCPMLLAVTHTQVAGSHPERFRLTRPGTGRVPRTVDLLELRTKRVFSLACFSHLVHAIHQGPACEPEYTSANALCLFGRGQLITGGSGCLVKK